MGIITNLVNMKAQKDLQAKQGTIDALKLVLSNKDATPQAHEWANQSLVNLLDETFAQGGGGKSKGGGGGGKSGGSGIGQVFGHILNGLTLGARGRLQEQGRENKQIEGDIGKIKASQPKQLTMTDEDKQALTQKNLQIEADAKVALEKRLGEQKGQQALAQEDQQWHAVYDRETKAGRTPEEARDIADQAALGVKTAAQTVSSTEKLVFTGPKGEELVLFRDPHTQKLYNLAGREVQVPDGFKVTKAEQDKGELQLREEALRDMQSGDPVKMQAAKGYLDSLALKKQGQEVNTNVKNQEAAVSKDITDDELRDLADLAIVTKQDPHIVTRNPELNTRYLKIKADQIKKGGGGSTVAGGQSVFHADTQSLAALTKIRDGMRASLAGTDAEIDRLKKLSDSIPLSDFKKFNTFQQFLTANLSDNPALARFREALLAARYRYNSMISNVRGGGAATNQVRTETAEDVIDRSMARGALNAAADEMKTGLQNMMNGLDRQVETVRQEVMTGGRGNGGTAAPQGTPTKTATGPNGQKLGLIDGKWVPIK